MSRRKHRNKLRQGKLLASLHKFKHQHPFWIYWYPEREKDEKKLSLRGLIKRVRRRYRDRSHRNAVIITTAGEDALYAEDLGAAKPIAKSRRKEKRGRHV